MVHPLPDHFLEQAISEDFVVFRSGKDPQEPTVITVNCMDKLGLACDLTRTILEFGLDVNRADFCTDLPWCYVVFWVLPSLGSSKTIQWSLLKKRLISIAPSPLPGLFALPGPSIETSRIQILQTWSENRIGLLNDMTYALWELELDVERFNALITPDGNAVNIFCVNDLRKVVQNRKQHDIIFQRIESVLGVAKFFKLIPGTADDDDKSSDLGMLPNIPIDFLNERSLIRGDNVVHKLAVKIDNSFSSVYTLLHIKSRFRKGLLYDCIRVLKDYNLQIAQGRFSKSMEGEAELELLISHADGSKLYDLDTQKSLEAQLAIDICDPVRVTVVDNGLHTELLIAATIERNGKVRPRLLYDITLVLKTLGICIFKGDVVRVSHDDILWEVYRFLLVKQLDVRGKSHVIGRLMGVLIG